METRSHGDFETPELTWGDQEVDIKATGENDPALAELQRQRQLERDKNYVVTKEVEGITKEAKSIKPPKHLDDPIHARELPLPDPKNNRSDKDHPWYENSSDLPN